MGGIRVELRLGSPQAPTGSLEESGIGTDTCQCPWGKSESLRRRTVDSETRAEASSGPGATGSERAAGAADAGFKFKLPLAVAGPGPAGHPDATAT